MDKILTFNGKIAAGGGRWITGAGSTPSQAIALSTKRFQLMDTPLCQSSSLDQTQGPNNSSYPDCGGTTV